MEQIVRIGDSLYYGKILCSSPDKAYRLFREDYHKEIGKDANRRLNREGQRTDVIHWGGFTLSEPYYRLLADKWGGFPKVRSSVIGILHTSYCRTIECQEFDNVDEDCIAELLDWVLSDKSKSLVLVNRKNGLGRTNKRHNINFR